MHVTKTQTVPLFSAILVKTTL